MKSKLILSIVIAGSLLSGCGGGGSSSSGNSGSSTASKVAITSSNQSTISNAAVNSATQNLSGDYLSFVGVQTSTSTPSTNDRAMTDLANLAFGQFIKHRNDPLTAAGASASANCGADSTYGTMSFATDGSSTTVPTYFTITFTKCVTSGTPTSGVTLNGTLSMNNMAITLNGSNVPTAITATFAFDLSSTDTLTATTHTGKINGGFTIAATGIGSASRTDSIKGTSFNESYDSKWVSLNNFSFKSTYDDSTLTHGYSDTVDYTIASDVINAGFTFQTINPLVRNIGDVYPRSGQVVISGASNTKLRVTVVSADSNAGTASGTVTLELDQGTGLGYGSPVTKTWTDLSNGV